MTDKSFLAKNGIAIQGSCTSLSQTTLTIGNSSINATSNSTTLALGNSSVSAVVNTINIVISNGSNNLVIDSIGISSGTTIVNNSTISVGSSVVANSSGVSVGANTLLDSSKLTIGNSTVNAIVNSTQFRLANSSTSVNLSSLGMLAGIVVLNSSMLAVGANVVANATALICGNSSVNITVTSSGISFSGVSINATAYPGVSNNASYLGGTAAASYQLNSTLSANVAGLTSNNSSYLGGTAAASYQLNSTLSANVAGLTSNNSSYLGGVAANAYLSTAGNKSIGGNVTFTGVISTASADILSQTLSDAATINWNVANGQIASVVLGGNRTMAAPTNLKVGTMILHVSQDATGSRTLAWNSIFKWTAGSAPVLSTGSVAHDVFSFIYDGTYIYGSFLPDVR